MARFRPKTFMAFGDAHFPDHNPVAISIVKKAVRFFQPDLIVCTGDMLDCGQFSKHNPSFRARETEYDDDLAAVNNFIDYCQKYCKKFVYVAGNHEYRVERWAAESSMNYGMYRMLSPRLNISRNRKRFQWVDYYNDKDAEDYPHYKINGRIVAVHGWSYAKHATKAHLEMSQGMSIIHGHTHRVDSAAVQHLWKRGDTIEACSTGCLCRLVPVWCCGRPVTWTNAFIMGYIGKIDDTLFTIKIRNSRAILPTGKEITA